jgi:hypothetical protein
MYLRYKRNKKVIKNKLLSEEVGDENVMSTNDIQL